ncbi:MAG: MFS transporter, partial [Gaiellaceae bacterium]
MMRPASPARRPGPLAAVGLSLAALTSANFAIVAFVVLAPELQLEFGFSKAEVGFLISLVFIGGALTSYPAGRLTDRLGPATVLGWALGLFSVAMLATAVAPNVAVFLVLIALGGVAYGGVNPPTNVAVASSFDQRLGFFLSVKQSGVPLGGLVAGVVLPPIVIAAGWRWGLVTAALSCMLVVAATPLLRGARVIVRDGVAPGVRSPLSRRELAALGAFGFVMSGTQWSIFAHLTLFLTEERAFSLASAGLGLALAQGLGAGAHLVW